MAEDRDELEELDVTPGADEDSPAGGGSADDHDDDDEGSSSDRSDRASRPTVNRWRGLQDRAGDVLRKGISGDEVDHQPDQADVDEEDREDLGEDEDLEGREDASDRREGADADDDEDAERKGGKGEGEGKDDDDDEDEPDRYQVVDANGDAFKIDLPDGAKIVFNADGERVELSSVDDLIQAAQKGLAFDRVTSRAGQENATLRKQISEFEQAQQDDSDLLLKLIFDELTDEQIEDLRKELEPYRDPKAREGMQALHREEERKKADASKATEEQQAAATKFWKAAQSQIKTDLPKHSFLDEDDVDEIQSRFYGLYQAELARLTPLYKAQAIEQKLPEKDALVAADRDARLVLTEKNLRKVMRELDAKYAKKGGGKGEKKGKREADLHNRRVDAKLDQRRDPRHRSLRGGGAAPRDRVGGDRRNEPKTFDGKIARGLARLRRAGAGSGADEE